MLKWGNETKIGLMIFVSIVLLVVGIMALGNYRFLRRGYTLTVMLNNVRGLRKGAPVTLLGMEIGKTQEISLRDNQVAVTVRIEHKFKFPVDSSAKLQTASMMGGKCIEFRPGTSEEYLKGGDTIIGEYEPEVAELATAAQAVSQQLQLVLGQLSSVLEQIRPEEINESFTSIKEAGQQLQKTALTSGRQLESALKSFETLAENLNDLANSPKVDSSFTALAQSSQDLKQITARLQRSSASLKVILGKVERGEGTLGKLAKDDSLYYNIQNLTEELRELIQDFRKHPRKYIRLKLF
jgi:phospholipid/cholesterol/gamma-HCH transport system substrate-binding protein